MTESLPEFGFSLSIPVGQPVVFMLVALLVGLVAAITSVRRAAQIDILDAVGAE